MPWRSYLVQLFLAIFRPRLRMQRISALFMELTGLGFAHDDDVDADGILRTYARQWHIEWQAAKRHNAELTQALQEARRLLATPIPVPAVPTPPPRSSPHTVKVLEVYDVERQDHYLRMIFPAVDGTPVVANITVDTSNRLAACLANPTSLTGGQSHASP